MGGQKKATGSSLKIKRKEYVSQAGQVIEAGTVVSEITFGSSSSIGTIPQYSRADHTHGTPPDPFPAFIAYILALSDRR